MKTFGHDCTKGGSAVGLDRLLCKGKKLKNPKGCPECAEVLLWDAQSSAAVPSPSLRGACAMLRG